MAHTIRSKIFNKTYLVADNQTQLEDICPIDCIPLVAITEYDFAEDVCKACNIHYDYRQRGNQEYYKQAVTKHLTSLEKEYGILKEKLSEIEKILNVGKKTS